MLSTNAVSQRAFCRWSIVICERARRRRFAFAIVAVWLATLMSAPMATAADAAAAYPPRAGCILSATADPHSADVTVRGSGFAPRQPVSLSVRGTPLTSPTSDADGSFIIEETLAAGLRPTATLHAQSGGCATDVAVTTTDAPGQPGQSGQPDKPGIGPHLGGVAPTDSVAAPHIGLASSLPTGGLGARLLLGIVALVIIVAVLLVAIAGRAGRRTP